MHRKKDWKCKLNTKTIFFFLKVSKNKKRRVCFLSFLNFWMEWNKMCARVHLHRCAHLPLSLSLPLLLHSPPSLLIFLSLFHSHSFFLFLSPFMTPSLSPFFIPSLSPLCHAHKFTNLFSSITLSLFSLRFGLHMGTCHTHTHARSAPLPPRPKGR